MNKENDYAYFSESLHSSYLFYTMEVDKLSKENKRLREALENIAIVQDNRCYCDRRTQLCPDCSLTTILNIAKGALCD